MKQRNLRAGDMALIGMFTALMAVGANITSMAPFFASCGNSVIGCDLSFVC